MSENYRVELSQLGIDVCIVEPGGFPTNFMERLIKPSDNSRNQYYSEISPTPEVSFSNFEHALAANPAQNPQNVANAILDLVQNDIGQRKFRTIVDKMGMGDHLQGYNDSLSQITNGIYGAFGINHLLSVKK